MDCSEMGLDIPDAECLAWMQQQQSDGPTLIVLFLLLVIIWLTALCENTIKN
jgi:hypothetical protein